MFVAAAGDYRLAVLSPCIDAGDNEALPQDSADIDGDSDTVELLPLDLDGNPRRVEDLSAYNTGKGTLPLTDMGVYESSPHQGFVLSTQAVDIAEGGQATIEVSVAMDPHTPMEISIASQGDSVIAILSSPTLVFDSSN